MNNILFDLFNLHHGEDDKEKTLETVKANISFTGANLWILACAIIVASVGLNVNSTAVIIGAMLISPLMGPIVASGFALGIFDFTLLKRALKNLLIATVASLLVSTVYFYLSPFKEVQSELLARTSPNIYDILIAFFGGLVGVIAVTRVEKGNPIPGVAIATALMPPLCTAGYGLAMGNIRFFLGAFFLYSINCVFICIATYSIVKILKYPAKEQVNIKQQKQIKYGISMLTLIMVIPSLFFAFFLLQQQKFDHTINAFIEQEFTQKGYIVVYKKTEYNATPKSVTLAFLSKQFSEKEIMELNTKLAQAGISNTQLVFKQNEHIANLQNNILNEISQKESINHEKDVQIKALQEEIKTFQIDAKPILTEATILFPTISAISIAKHASYAVNDSVQNNTILIYKASKELSDIEKTRFHDWLVARNHLDNLVLFFEP
jgi:uncharacterized hydrophobic protein (TIGR00271 family)